MILRAAAKIVRHGAPVFHWLVIHLEAPIFNNLDVIRSPMKRGVNNILKLTYLLWFLDDICGFVTHLVDCNQNSWAKAHKCLVKGGAVRLKGFDYQQLGLFCAQIEIGFDLGEWDDFQWPRPWLIFSGVFGDILSDVLSDIFFHMSSDVSVNLPAALITYALSSCVSKYRMSAEIQWRWSAFKIWEAFSHALNKPVKNTCLVRYFFEVRALLIGPCIFSNVFEV